jgi:hypothetical protein
MKYLKKFESFNIDEDSEHLKDLSLDLQDEGEWSITIHTNTEKYNEDEYSCKVILEPLDEFDWDGPGVAEGNTKGGKINDTLIQYLEDIVEYMNDYDYKIILTSNDGFNFVVSNDHHEINLENVEEFKKWTQRELKHQRSDIMTYGFKGDLIVIEFYEKDDEINESNIEYKYDWCQPESPIRKEIEQSIKDILLELKDSNSLYTHHISWIQDDPHIWISGKLKSNSGFSRYRPVLDEVNPVIDEITSYLRSEGFDTRLDYLPNKENCRQFYIYFKEKSSS